MPIACPKLGKEAQLKCSYWQEKRTFDNCKVILIFPALNSLLRKEIFTHLKYAEILILRTSLITNVFMFKA